eukprot:scaffold103880_cov36-Phaeocystis_antarctica.AAC.1
MPSTSSRRSGSILFAQPTAAAGSRAGCRERSAHGPGRGRRACRFAMRSPDCNPPSPTTTMTYLLVVSAPVARFRARPTSMAQTSC